MIQIIHGLFEVLTAIFEAFLEVIGSIAVECVPTRRKTKYDADFGIVADILQKHDNGFHVASVSNSLTESFQHLIAFGGTGSGKSTNITIPSLLQSHATSYIINDPAHEALDRCAPFLQKNGYAIAVINFNNPEHSRGFNPLAYCNSQMDAYSLANVIIRNSIENGQYDYWAQSSESLLAFFFRYLIMYAKPEYRTIPNALYLIRVFSFAPKRMDQLIVSTNDVQLLTQYKSLVTTPSKTLQCTISTAVTALRIYEAPNIAAISSLNQIEFDQFRRQKTALFLCSSAGDSYIYRALTASFFETLFSHFLHQEFTSSDLPITLFIDEASSMKLPSLPQALALTRKHGLAIATLWQDYHQVKQLYGEHEAVNIFANSNMKVFMPSGQPLDTCTMLEKLLGKYSFVDDDGNRGVRELLTAQEIRELDKILVLNGNKKALLLKPHPYYSDKRLRNSASQVPYDVPYNNFLTQPTFIELPN